MDLVLLHLTGGADARGRVNDRELASIFRAWAIEVQRVVQQDAAPTLHVVRIGDNGLAMERYGRLAIRAREAILLVGAVVGHLHGAVDERSLQQRSAWGEPLAGGLGPRGIPAFREVLPNQR